MCIALSAVLLFGMLSCTAMAEEAKDRVLKTEEEYLSAYEEMGFINDWAMKYVDDFYAKPTFDSLLRAAAAVSAAETALAHMEVPQNDIHDEDLLELFSEGADIFLLTEMRGVFLERQSDYAIKFIRLQDTLLTDAVYLPFHKAITEELEAEKTYELCCRQSVCHEANYLLLQFDGAEKWNTYTIDYPHLFADHPAWDSDADHLYQEEEKVLDVIEENNLRGDRWNALFEYNYDKMEEELANDTERPLEEILAAKDAIDRIYPQPIWYCTTDYMYCALNMDEKGHVSGIVKAGDDLTQLPNANQLMMPKVTREEVVEYVAHLREYGFEPQIQETDDEYLCWIGNKSCPMILNWKAGEGASITFLHGVGCMIPEWMLYM